MLWYTLNSSCYSQSVLTSAACRLCCTTLLLFICNYADLLLFICSYTDWWFIFSFAVLPLCISSYSDLLLFIFTVQPGCFSHSAKADLVYFIFNWVYFFYLSLYILYFIFFIFRCEDLVLFMFSYATLLLFMYVKSCSLSAINFLPFQNCCYSYFYFNYLPGQPMPMLRACF